MGSIILLEDVDAAFVTREQLMEADDPDSKKTVLNEAAYQGLNRLTFSGLLNAIIVFMTTNYADRLDPALIRPGRVDLMQFIGHSTESQCIQMFRRFYPDSHPQLATEFAQQIAKLGVKVSATQLQGFFMFYKSEATRKVWRLKPK